jgi:electron transfer flavoprotein alpha subunit
VSVLAICQGGHRMTLEALAAAQEMGAEAGGASAAVVGNAGGLESKKLDRVHAIQHELLARYTADGYAAAFEQLIRAVNPSLVLFPHTYQVRDFAPKLATRFGRVLLPDAVKLRLDGDGFVVTRQLFQGKLNADYRVSGPGPHFVSIQAGAYRADAAQAGSAPVETFSPKLDTSLVRAKPEEPFRESQGAVDLTAAEIIVSVGRGIKEKDNIGLVEELAKAMGGELAASRPICDNGWLPMERQVGSSGQTVAPKLYLAIGISGAIQHLVGMKGSKTIVAINKDPDAPIFEAADYGIVGDLFEVVPALTEEIKKAKS